jgi:uncharacterized membrane protein
MNGFEIRMQPVVSLPLVIAVTAILLALLVVRPRNVVLSGWQWGSLIGLRILVVLLMLFAMLRPALVYSKVEPVAASLIMLVDDSRSMQVADSLGDKPRWDVVHRLLDSAANDLAKLNQKLTVSVYEFDGQIRKLNMHEGKLELSAVAEGEESAIGAAITESLEHETNKRVLATLLLSDGAQRAVPPRDLPPQVAARRLKAENIPIYTFVFGRPGGRERADLSVSDLLTNETIFSEAPTEVRAQLSANGYANQRVKVQLLWESEKGMEVVDTVQVDTGVEGGAVPVVLHYTPHTPGEYKVTVRVEPREGELVTTNNEVSTFVTVRAGGINVLYLVGAKRIGGGPGQEQRFVRAALAHSPDIVVDRRLIKYDPPGLDIADAFSGKRGAMTAGEEPPRARTGAPDVVVLDDVDVQGLSADSWKAIAQHVRTGMGLIMLGGYHSFGPGGFRDSPLADVLPIQIGPAQRQAFGETPREDVQVRGPLKMLPVAPLGTRHPILQLSASNPAGRGGLDASNSSDAAQLWDKLPPLDGANRIGRNELKPNAQVLAEGNDAQRSPLLIAGQSGEGRVLAFAGDSTWHWQMAGFGEAHRRFWRQCVLWLAKKDEQTEGRVWIRLAGRRAMRGSRVELNVGAENAQGEPVANAQFDVAVQTPDGKTEKVQPSKTGSNWAAVFRQTAKAGDYRILVKAKDGNQELGTAQARFLVPNQDLELDRPAAEPSLMAQLAETTRAAGGAALAPEELPDLLRRLAEKPPELKQEVIAKVTYWDSWPFFLAVVGLLGSEWYLRKRWGLV